MRFYLQTDRRPYFVLTRSSTTRPGSPSFEYVVRGSRLPQLICATGYGEGVILVNT